jgi:hypothetical protein
MKEKFVNAALITAGIIFSLLALEVGLRIYPYLTGNHYPTAFDAELGWAPKPGVQEHDYIWGTTMTTLEDGTRSNGGGQVRNATEPILAVGDSFTWGDDVSDWETWPAQLEKLAGKRVINGGVSGYGADQAFLRARRLLSLYHFSTVIFSFIPGDIERGGYSVMFHNARPYFDLKDGRLTLENVPVPPPSPPPKESGLLAALEHSRLVQFVTKRTFPELLESPLRPEQTRVLDEQEGRAVACALFHELEGLTSRGSELIVLFQHHEAETPAMLMTAEIALSCLSNPTTRVLDLKPALSELKAKDLSSYKRLYIPNNGHMTAEGNHFVALEISKILTERVNLD